MKRVRLAILFLLILLCSIAFAALTKTTSIVVLDAWQSVASGTLTTGSAGDIQLSYDTILYLEIAYADAATQDGVGVSIEVSYGDDDWTLLTQPFTTPSASSQSGTITLDGAVGAGDTVIALSDASAYSTPAQKWFIVDGTVANSESVRTKSAAANNVTLCHDVLRGHGPGLSVFVGVHDYIIPIPAAFAYVRVLINNTDADADVHFTTRISKVTAL